MWFLSVSRHDSFLGCVVCEIAQRRRARRTRRESTQREAVHDEQVRQLLDVVAGTRDEAAIVLLVTIGLRRGELLGLQWSDVDLDAKTLWVRRALKRTTNDLEATAANTAFSERTVRLLPVAVSALKAHRARQNAPRLEAGDLWTDGGWLLTNYFGDPLDPDNFRHRFIDLREEADIGHWTPHDARHIAGSLMFELGADLKVVSATLGNSSIRVTADVYACTLTHPDRVDEIARFAAEARRLVDDDDYFSTLPMAAVKGRVPSS